MRKILKILHTLAACGLIGGLGAYAILLAVAPQETPAAYADLRQSIALVGNYLLLPSLAVALVTGLLSMAAHTPFADQGWAWLKAALGILMFRGVLMLVGSMADHAATVSRRIAEGEPAAKALDAALAHEWYIFAVVVTLAVANVVLGTWRPRLSRPARPAAGRAMRPAPAPAPAAAPETHAAPDRAGARQAA